ncbi:odorant receptor 23a-like [Nilaparvata lugens]|uniref:odorant receptor 23a-like n=1 Tax=Nilaparvata lugens TaxID=108931 RepID=UPI00193E61FC|nr:odorant receptor 23a-like [Nilaparvata lugens]
MIGIWNNEKSRRINKPKAAMFIAVLLFVPLNILTNFQQFESLVAATEILLLTSIMFHSLLTYMVFIIYQDIICDNISIIENRFNNFERNLLRKSNFQRDEEKLVMFLYRILSCIFIGAVLVYAVAPFCGIDFPFLLSLPYVDEGSFSFPYLTYTAIVLVSTVQASVQIATTIVYGGCISMANAQIKMLGQSYRDMGTETYKLFNTFNIRDHQAIEIIKRNVGHYLFLKRFCNQTFKVFSAILLSQFVIAEVIACYCFFQIYEGVKMMSLYRITCGLLLLSSISIHAFINFYCGERLTSTSNEFQYDLYCSHWYTSSVKVRKMLIIVAECQKKPIIFKAGSIVPITLGSFVTAVQAAVSYFNLLLALAKQMEKKYK